MYLLCLLSRLLTFGTMDFFQNDMGKGSKLLGIIKELHTNMKSRVLFKSDILQGSRQSGVSSPFYHLCFYAIKMTCLNN